MLSCSRLVLLFITESSVLLRLNYWFLCQCHRAQDRTIADWQNTTAIKLTFKNRHTKVLHCFFQRCNSIKMLAFKMNNQGIFFNLIANIFIIHAASFDADLHDHNIFFPVTFFFLFAWYAPLARWRLSLSEVLGHLAVWLRSGPQRSISGEALTVGSIKVQVYLVVCF